MKASQEQQHPPEADCPASTQCSARGARMHRSASGRPVAAAVWAAGKKYVSWGAPTPPGSFESGFEHVSDLKGRPHSILPSNERFSHQPAVSSGRDEIAKAWQDARAAGFRSSDGTVTTTWNRPMVALGVVVLLWVFAAQLF